jgi:signal transduction histidine kinase
MKSVWLAVKIAAAFFVVMTTFVIVTLHLFARTMVQHNGGVGLPGPDEHHLFVMAVIKIALVAIAIMILIAIYVTAPLRSMSRSMDRVAAGDLDHRVKVRGNDEGAAMGRSFNAMADRVRTMLIGQKELMAGVSHELRSPLTRMKLSLELMRREQTTDGRIQELEDEVDELDGLVEELLLSSRIDLGSRSLTTERLDLADLCTSAWERVESRAQQQGMTLRTESAASAAMVRADRVLVVRILGNLFENSVRYAGEGEILLSAERRQDRVELRVSDSGPGVEDGQLEAIFEPFYRADASRSRRTGAAGIGLMIVRRAVEAHAGQVRARRIDGGGFEISFDLPSGV